MPLRTKLPLISAALVALALLVAGTLATLALRSYLMTQVDSELMRAVQMGASAPPPDAPPGPSPLQSDLIVVFADPQGNPTQTLSNLPDGVTAPTIETLPTQEAAARAGVAFTSDGWRVMVQPTAQGSVTVATSLAGVDSTVQRLVLLELTVGTIALAITAAVSTLAVRRSLRPLQDVQHTAAAITAGDLSHRVGRTDERTEAGEVGLALNSMLDQLETSANTREEALAQAQASEARMRQFIADASHELRTPLTSVRGIAELYRHGAVPADATDQSFAQIEDQARRMGLLVDELLLLARLDAQRPFASAPVDLLEICASAVRDTHHESRQIRLEAALGGQPPVVDGDAARLRQVVDNLIANAMQHGAGTVEVTVATDAASALISVHDEGAGIPDAEREIIFDRFYRRSDDRSRNTGGSGLGLSIVAALVAAHDGTVTAQGSTFTVSIPLAGPDRQAVG
ncbi:MAG: HAMP domain-containing histidine kinase [Candidatus Nanopelagicales bacterium]|jgi:two-component system OmpR family sensor kinase|nr:HAMP domain-containing histidine kinase [Candidatus Nanopelagicales bacterium]